MIPVCQCWDDGVSTDIRLAEILRRHGAKASFNLCLATHSTVRTSGWKFRGEFPVWKLATGELLEAYEGFTIANHTLSHPRLTELPSREAEREIRDGRVSLQQFFQQPVEGFAYPYGSHDPAIAGFVKQAGHLYARTTGTATDQPPGDGVSVHPIAHFISPTFWEEFQRCKERSIPFYFWGHSYEIVSEEMWETFESTIARINGDPETQWVDVVEIADTFVAPPVREAENPLLEMDRTSPPET